MEKMNGCFCGFRMKGGRRRKNDAGWRQQRVKGNGGAIPLEDGIFGIVPGRKPVAPAGLPMLEQDAVLHMDGPVGQPGIFRVVSNHHHGQAIPVEVGNQFHD